MVATVETECLPRDVHPIGGMKEESVNLRKLCSLVYEVKLTSVHKFWCSNTETAGTTEKIFESKTSLYDVYVDNQVVRTHNPVLKELLKCSSADREKLQKLNNLRSAHQFSYEELGEENIDEEEVFVSFFHEQNNRLFQTLLDVANSQDTQLTSDHMKSMGLDPQGDRQFLMELVEHYGIDVVLMVDNPCCPK